MGDLFCKGEETGVVFNKSCGGQGLKYMVKTCSMLLIYIRYLLVVIYNESIYMSNSIEKYHQRESGVWRVVTKVSESVVLLIKEIRA